jgi:hypothetical protein
MIQIENFKYYKRVCIRCNKVFEGAPHSQVCPDCKVGKFGCRYLSYNNICVHRGNTYYKSKRKKDSVLYHKVCDVRYCPRQDYYKLKQQQKANDILP